MPCYSPLLAIQPAPGARVLVLPRTAEPDGAHVESQGGSVLRIPCGRCIGCRLSKQSGWALRCLCEAAMHEDNWFPTFTYDDDHLPMHGSLNYGDMVLFFNRLRRRIGPFRYFVAGEYGDSFGRCHWHALLFGLRLPDVERLDRRSRHPIYRSALLDEIWGKGHVFLGRVTEASAKYCASYTVKKITGAAAEEHYTRADPATGELVQLVPEFARMSLNPGIGRDWLAKYYPEVLAHGGVVSAARVAGLPRYFDQRLRSMFSDPEFQSKVSAQLDAHKEKRVRIAEADSFPARLAVREQCRIAGVAFKAERLR